jgi:hypothetical protein
VPGRRDVKIGLLCDRLALLAGYLLNDGHRLRVPARRADPHDRPARAGAVRSVRRAISPAARGASVIAHAADNLPPALLLLWGTDRLLQSGIGSSRT